MTVEIDAARVQAVTDKLTGPRTVWVLNNDDAGAFGTSTWVYATEAVARESWKSLIQHYSPDDAIALVGMIEAGETGFETFGDSGDWWSLSEEPVREEPWTFK